MRLRAGNQRFARAEGVRKAADALNAWTASSKRHGTEKRPVEVSYGQIRLSTADDRFTHSRYSQSIVIVLILSEFL